MSQAASPPASVPPHPIPLPPQPEGIPSELCATRQWVAWRYEWREGTGEGEGKWTKAPVIPHTGWYASTTKPATWRTFDQAFAYARQRHSEDGGVGFVVTEGDPFTGIDIDGCRDPETGEISASIMAIVAALDSYTEISVSGTGLRIMIRAMLPPGGRNRRPKLPAGCKEIEIYDRERYFTLTGHRLPDTPAAIANRQAELDDLHAQLFPPQAPAVAPPAPPPATGVDLDDDELLRRAHAARDGARFARLWAGDWTGGRYRSQSEADQALYNLLAFWTGGDRARMRRLFQQSGLYRAKKKGAKYHDVTIETALTGTRDYYSGRRSAVTRPRRPVTAGAPVVAEATERESANVIQLADYRPEEREREPARREMVPGTRAWLTPERDAIYRMDRGGDLVVTHPWCPQVLARITVAGGEEGRIAWYEIAANGGTAVVSDADLRRGTCWERFNLTGTAGKGNIDLLANVVQLLAQSARAIPGYHRTGWHRIPLENGETQWGYVTPHGGVTPPLPEDALVTMVGFDQEEQERSADAAGEVEGCDLSAARAAIEELWALAPHGHLMIALGAIARAALYTIYPAEMTLILEGASSSGKTGTFAIASALTAPYRWPPLAVAGFNDTAAAIEHNLALHNDAPALVDDLVVGENATPAEKRAIVSRLESIVRPVANAAPTRKRMGRDNQPRADKQTQTMPIISAEKLPDDMLQSFLRRSFILSYERNQLDTEGMAERGREIAGQLANLGAVFLSHYGERLQREGRDAVAADLELHLDAKRHALDAAMRESFGGALPQIAGSVITHGAQLLLGLQLLDDLLALPGQASHAHRALQAVAGYAVALVQRIGEHGKDDGVPRFTRLMQAVAENTELHIPVLGIAWRIDAYLPGNGPPAPPRVLYDAGKEDTEVNLVPLHIWGWAGPEWPSPHPGAARLATSMQRSG